MGGIALERNEKTRLSVTLLGLYMDRLDRLVEMGIYLDPQDAIRDSLRKTFRAYGIEPFTDKDREAVKVPEDAARS